MDDNEVINRKIDETIDRLQSLEDIDPYFLTEDLKRLRHHILHIHARIEAGIETLIGKYLLENSEKNIIAKDTVLKLIKIDFHFRLSELMDDMGFYKKITFAQKVKIISKTQCKEILKVNRLRNIFSHAKSHLVDINELKTDRKKYLKALNMLVTAYNILDELFTSKGK